MGLAPKQRERFSTQKHGVAALVPVPLSRRANRVGGGPREKGTGTVTSRFPAVPRQFRHGASPRFSLVFLV